MNFQASQQAVKDKWVESRSNEDDSYEEVEANLYPNLYRHSHRRRCSCMLLSCRNDLLHTLSHEGYVSDGRKGSLRDENQRTFIFKRSFTVSDLTLIHQWQNRQIRWKDDSRKRLYRHSYTVQPIPMINYINDVDGQKSLLTRREELKAAPYDVDVLDCYNGPFEQDVLHRWKNYLLDAKFRSESLPSHHNSDVNRAACHCKRVLDDTKNKIGSTCNLNTTDSISIGRRETGEKHVEKYICECGSDKDKSIDCYGKNDRCKIPINNSLIVTRNYSDDIHQDSYKKLDVHKLAMVDSDFSERVADGNTFAMKVQSLESWFDHCDDAQRNQILKGLLDKCKVAQMHMLSMVMAPILHKTCPFNCEDILTWLPSHISHKILTYLDPVSLCQCSLVNRSWHRMANDEDLWVRLCKQPQWTPSDSSLIEERLDESYQYNKQNWKATFGERYRLYRNWVKGHCSVRIFEGHSQGISCVKFDNRRIVTSSYDKKIKVWNIRTNSPWSAMTLAGHTGTVRCMDLKGDRLVTGSCDCTIKVWDLHMSQTWSSVVCRATLLGHQHTVRCLQMVDDLLVSGSYDRTLRIWDIKTKTCVKILRGHSDCVLCLHYKDGILASGSYDCSIKIWNISNRVCLNTLLGHERAVTCVQIADNQIISGSIDRNILFWDICTGSCTRKLDWISSEGHTAPIRSLQVDRWRIVSAADDKTIKVWCLKTGKRLATFIGHQDGVTHLQFNDRVIVSGSYDTTVRLWDFSVC